MILDTDILVGLLHNDQDAKDKLRELMEQDIPLKTTSICAFELFDGAWRSKQGKENFRLVSELLQQLGKLDFNFSAADVAGRIKAQLAAKGDPLDAMDIMIGSIAVLHDETVLTRNVRHFSRISDLKVEKW